MSLPSYLAKIKSSGIYRFVWDKSEIAGVDAEILRLVVGYSEKGPFNTPVYVTSTSEFKTIFGGISKKLEKRGIWFHRMALQALEAGPIICLNLKKFKNEKISTASFAVQDADIKLTETELEKIYDTSRFWKLDPTAIKDAYATVNDAGGYISFAAADSAESSCSIFIRGYHPNGYDVTVKNWFTSAGEEVPDYFTTDDKDFSSLLVSDFFAEVYVFKGEFTPALVATEPLNKYFDIVDGKVQLKEYIENAFGEKTDTLTALSNDTASNFINSYQGTLLPYFKSSTNAYISLDLLFNADYNSHKMMMNLDSDSLYDGTLSVDNITTTGWTSKQVLGAMLKQTSTTASLGGINTDGEYDIVFTNDTTAAPTVYDADYIKLTSGTDSVKLISCTVQNTVNWENLGYIATTGVDALSTYENKYKVEKISDLMESGIQEKDSVACIYCAFNNVVSTVNIETQKIEGAGAWLKIDQFINKETDVTVTFNNGSTITFRVYNANGKDVTVPNKVYSTIEYKLNTSADNTVPSNVEKIYKKDTEDSSDLKDVEFIAIAKDGTILYKKQDTWHIDGDEDDFSITEKFYMLDYTAIGIESGNRVLYGNELYTVTVATPAVLKLANFEGKEQYVYCSDADQVTVCNHSASISNYNLVPYYFKGYTFESSKPDSAAMYDKLQWQKGILSALIDYPGIRTALTSKTDIDYRYIVDTFEAYVDSEVHKELALICKEKDNALGLLNFPTVKTFKDCPYSKFVDDDGRFQVKYIKEGANKKKNPGVLFSLVSENNGASYVSYNTPLQFSDGTVKTYVPAAALVSNLFMKKYEGRQPYYIVAGPNYGRIIADGLIGPDFNYTRADLDILEPMGVNCMVYVPRTGTYINSNQTAKQNPVTALSKINVRELVIYLQDEIEKLLQNYQWEFNTQALRDTVKAKADTICERIKNNGGIYEYLNVCDESNNTDDVINNEMFVLSTSIEPGMGCGKMVQELTIYKKGGMSSKIS